MLNGLGAGALEEDRVYVGGAPSESETGKYDGSEYVESVNTSIAHTAPSALKQTELLDSD